MVADIARKRRTWTRSKRSCKTCRLRHVKCDETYPACKRCTSSGRTCDGCSPLPDGWEVTTASSISPGLGRRSSPEQYDEQAESVFTFFQTRTLDYLAHLLDDQWKPLVLRAAEQNEAIYHAALAIGSIHKTTLQKQALSSSLYEDEYAVKQYTKSLRKLALPDKVDSTNSPDAILAACVLFIGFESLRRNHGVALEHIKSGVRILEQRLESQGANRSDNMIPLHQFILAFARLEQQKQEMTGGESRLVHRLTMEQTAAGYFEDESTHPQPIPQFATLDDAWIDLHRRWHALIAWTGNVHRSHFGHQPPVPDMLHWLFHVPYDPELDQRKFLVQRGFDLWSLGLKNLGNKLSKPSPKEAAILALLECHGLLAENVLNTTFLSHETIWDHYLERFRSIVDLCRKVIDYELCEYRNSHDTSSTPVVIQHRYAPSGTSIDCWPVRSGELMLSFDMGVIMILLHAFMKCRNARLRLDVIKLLEDNPRLEGVWDSIVIAQFSRAVDSVERDGCSLEEAAARGASAAEIPLHQRVISINGALNTDSRSANLIMFKAKSKDDNEPIPVVHILVW